MPPHRPSIKSHKPTHQNCPYTRPCITKPSNCSIKPISGPPQQDKLCPYNMLVQLISLNGLTQLHISPSPSPSPSHSSCSSSSLDSNPVSPRSTKSTENTESSSESGSTSSLESTASDRQLHPCLPIWYNETFLMKLNDKPQIATLNYLSIPLPPSDTDEEEDMDTTLSSCSTYYKTIIAFYVLKFVITRPFSCNLSVYHIHHNCIIPFCNVIAVKRKFNHHGTIVNCCLCIFLLLTSKILIISRPR